MAEATKIEWADSTFNPWMGCTKVSPACDHCYAETLMDKRHGRVQWGPHGHRVRTSASNWQNPRRWQRQAAAFRAEHGRRRRVFCASLADVFDNQVPAAWRADLWDLIRETPDLDWLLLTKRPQNIARMVPTFWNEISDRIWLGVSTENQVELERREKALASFAIKFKLPRLFFASAEPLLGPLDFGWAGLSIFTWIIAGGESGSGARPTHPNWVRSIRDQCVAAGVPFLFKQWGEWLVGERCHDEESSLWASFADGDEFHIVSDGHDIVACIAEDHVGAPEKIWRSFWSSGTGQMLKRPGKKRPGRLLDGVTHDAFPEARP